MAIVSQGGNKEFFNISRGHMIKESYALLYEIFSL